MRARALTLEPIAEGWAGNFAVNQLTYKLSLTAGALGRGDAFQKTPAHAQGHKEWGDEEWAHEACGLQRELKDAAPAYLNANPYHRPPDLRLIP